MPATPQPVSYLRQNGIAIWGNAAGAAPVFSTHPASASVLAPAGASFSATVANAVTAIWQRTNPPSIAFADIPGATGDTLTLASTTLQENGAKFRRKATNQSGVSYSNEATLTVAAVLESSLTITPPTAVTVGVAAPATIRNIGTAAGDWSASIDNGATLSPATGTLAAGAAATVMVTAAVAASHTIQLVNTSGGAGTGPSASFPAFTPLVTTGKYRHQQRLLFHRAHTESVPLSYVNSLGQTINVPNRNAYFDNYHPNSATEPTYGCGSNVNELCAMSLWAWDNVGTGDWLGNDSPTPLPQSNVPFAATPLLPSNTPAGEVAVDVTALVQNCDSNKYWYAFMVRVVGYGYLTLTGPLSTTNTPSVLEVTRNGVTTTHDLWYACTLKNPLTASQMEAQKPNMAVSSGTKAAIEFERPVNLADQDIPCTQAILRFRHEGVAFGPATVEFYRVNVSIPDMSAPVAGVAGSYPFDSGLYDHPDCAGGFWVKDGMVISDILDEALSGTYNQPWIPGNTSLVTNPQEALFDPTCWGTPGVGHMASVAMPSPAVMATLLPHRVTTPTHTKLYGQVFKSDLYGDTAKVYSSADLVAEGFPVLAPGFGALRMRYSECGVLHGQCTYAGTTTGGPLRPGTSDSSLYLAFKRAHTGRVIDGFTRGYYMLGGGWDPLDSDLRWYIKVPAVQGHPNMGKFPEQNTPTPVDPFLSATQWKLIDRAGKFPGGIQHLTGSFPVQTYIDPSDPANSAKWGKVGQTPAVRSTPGAGYSMTSGVFGYQGRWMFKQGYYKENYKGPACGGAVIGLEHVDFARNWACIQSQQPVQGWDAHWQSVPHKGGLGHLYPRKWYCVEHHWHMNTITFPYVEPAPGTHWLEGGFLVDGYEEWFVDGVLAGTSPLWANRSSVMVDWALQISSGYPFDNSTTNGQAMMRPMTNVPAAEYMGAREAILQTYYGGQSANARNLDVFINSFVVFNGRYVGPMAGVSRENGGLGLLPDLQISGSVWTPNRDATDKVIDSDFQMLPVNQPLFVSGTAAAPVIVQPSPFNSSGYGGDHSIMMAWSGAVHAKSIDSLLFSGGGHGDSAPNQNEVLALSLRTMRMSNFVPRTPDASRQSWNYTTSALQPGYVNFSSQNSPQLDGKPGSIHTFNGMAWVPGALYGNLNGALFRPGNACGFLDLDTLGHSVLYWNAPPDGSRDWSNSAYLMVDSKLWGLKAVPTRWERFDWTQTTATDWSNSQGGAQSKGKPTTFYAGASGFSVWNSLLIKMEERGEIASFGAASKLRVRLGALSASGAVDDTSASPFTDVITLTSADGSHTMFEPSYTADTGGSAGVTGMMHMAAAVYDAEDDCVWVWGNLVGGHIYKITNLNTNIWTTERIAGTGSLSAAWDGQYHGSYGKAALWKRGAAKGLVRVDRIDTNAQIIRLK